MKTKRKSTNNVYFFIFSHAKVKDHRLIVTMGFTVKTILLLHYVILS